MLGMYSMIFLRLIQQFINENRFLFGSYVLCYGISYCLFFIIAPYLIQKITKMDYINEIGTIIKYVIFLALTMIVFYALRKYLFYKMEPKLDCFLKNNYYDLYIRKFEKNYKENVASKHIPEILNAVYDTKSLFLWIIDLVLPVSILMMGVVCYFLVTDLMVGLLLFLFTLLILCIVVCNIPNVLDMIHNEKRNVDRLHGTMNDNISNLMSIYLNNKIEDHTKTFSDITKQHTAVSIYNTYRVELFMVFVTCILYSFFLIAIVHYYLQFKHYKKTTSEFITIVMILLLYCNSCTKIFDRLSFIFKRIISLLTISNLLHTTEDMNDYTTHEFQGDVALEQVTFSYDDKPILENVSLHLHPGECVVLVGQTGSGKSTLVKLLLGFYPIQKGRITFDGRDSKDIDIKHLRTHVHYINQKTHLFHDTILRNIQYGTDASREEVTDLLCKYDLLTVFGDSGSEDKLNRMVEMNGSNMSMGMQKVIIVVRGMLHASKVLVIDEPFSSVDTATRDKILRLLRDKIQGKTTLIITHDMNGLETLANRTISMQDVQGHS